MPTFNDLAAFCRAREVDLVIVTSPAPFVLCLHGEFDGYGDFFSILAKDIEYVELSAGFTVGDLRLVDQTTELAALSPKWSRLSELYSGSALAFRAADALQWGTDRHDFVIVANHIEWRPGRDWR